MSNRTNHLPEDLYAYLLRISREEHPALRGLREATASLPDANMQIGPEQGRLLALLVELIGARRALEVGTFTGYSALAVALALPEDGRLVACDVSEEWTSVGRRFWAEAGVEGRIELRLAPAEETLRKLLDEGARDSFDFAFIDADKPNYGVYFELVLELVRPGGLIAVDNVLWEGKVSDPAVNDAETAAIRALNAALRDDARVSTSVVPIGDGLTLARRRG